MSETTSINRVGPSRWSFMANVMSECLTRIVEARRIEEELGGIPRGVYRAAQEFFHLALQAVGDALPDDPPASVNAYLVATDSARRSSTAVPQTNPALEDLLKKYASFLGDRLKQAGDLSESEVEIGTSLQGFFVRLAQDGDAEAYEGSFCSLALPKALRYH